MNGLSKILIVSSLLLIAFYAEALTISTDNLVLSPSPAYPKANSEFIIKAKTFSFDATRARFTWYLDGKKIDEGTGLTEQTFVARKLGSKMNIRAAVLSADGEYFEDSITISVSDIDLIISPLTYTPPFYRGAPLASPGSVVEIIAIPHLYSGSARINPQSLIYEWSLNNKPVQNQSGGGKNILSLKLADVSNSEQVVTLKASTVSGNTSVERNVRVRTYQPEILFYETNSVTGKKVKASSFFNFTPASSFSILAEPFYMALESLLKSKFTWFVNGNIFSENAKNPLVLDLTAPPDSESQTNFSLKIEDVGTLFQRVSGILTVRITK
ncbi:hypothetical protein HYS99_00560 [Candidatus Giovannonibacteria bacterium]|nr:hypothetical protein [Candidatus Giovannonibacteria bacterium]